MAFQAEVELEKKKTAIITGGGQGMGKSCAIAFAEIGIRTVINDIDELKAQKTVDDIKYMGGESMIAAGDVTSKSDINKVLMYIVDNNYDTDSIIEDIDIKNESNIYCHTNNDELYNIISIAVISLLAHHIILKIPFVSIKNNSRLKWVPGTKIEIYSTSKQLLDRVIIAYGEKKQLTYTLFRPFNWIGPKLDSLKQAQLGNGRVPIIMINNLINNNNIVLVDGGKQTRSFTYIDDGIEALVKIIYNRKKLNKKIFNIGSPQNNVSIKKFSEMILVEFEKLSSKKYTGKIVSKSQKQFYGKGYEDIKIRVPDISEARKYLKWEPKTSLKQAIKLMLTSYRVHFK